MGSFNWPMRISSMDGRAVPRHSRRPSIPAPPTPRCPQACCEQIGVTPIGKSRFLLADGRRMQMDYGEARATVDGESVTTLVVFGEEGAPPTIWVPTPWKAWRWLSIRWISDWCRRTWFCTRTTERRHLRDRVILPTPDFCPHEPRETWVVNFIECLVEVFGRGNPATRYRIGR